MQGDAEAEGGAEHRVGDAGVAAGGVEQPPLWQQPAREAVEHDRARRAVLHAAAGVGASSFAKSRTRAPRVTWRQLHERRAADAIEDRVLRVPMPINVVNATAAVNPRGRTSERGDNPAPTAEVTRDAGHRAGRDRLRHPDRSTSCSSWASASGSRSRSKRAPTSSSPAARSPPGSPASPSSPPTSARKK